MTDSTLHCFPLFLSCHLLITVICWRLAWGQPQRSVEIIQDILLTECFRTPSYLLFSNVAADSHQISKTLWTSPKQKPRLRRLWWKRCAVSSGVRCFILWVFEKEFPKLPPSLPPGVLVAHDEGMVQPWKAMIMVFHSLMNPGFGAWCGQVALWLSSRAVASHGCVAVKNTMLVECSAKCLPGLR